MSPCAGPGARLGQPRWGSLWLLASAATNVSLRIEAPRECGRCSRAIRIAHASMSRPLQARPVLELVAWSYGGLVTNAQPPARTSRCGGAGLRNVLGGLGARSVCVDRGL